MTAYARRATCPTCRCLVAVKKDGHLRHHKPYLGSGPDYYRCVGSGTLPLEDRDDQATEEKS